MTALTEELEQSRGGIRDQLKEKDAKINTLVEELGNSQAMLNDKVAELAEVCLGHNPCSCECLHHLAVYASSKLHLYVLHPAVCVHTLTVAHFRKQLLQPVMWCISHVNA